ncbi:MAG: metalloregulator ArsR/SmtB family transcription factor [Chloroflexi bacterium]|nr:metalloregulator ArsR/SmtB family transcription factor [Chloroflexota bacterium]
MFEERDVILERQARLCQILADMKRLRLLHALGTQERSVSELAELIGASQSNTSQHLASMRDIGLVVTRRVGTAIYYHLAYPRILEACTIVEDIVRQQLLEGVLLAGTSAGGPGSR